MLVHAEIAQLGRGDALATHVAQLKLRVSGRLKQGWRSQMIRYGLRRDLEQSIDRPSAKIPIDVRPLAEADLDILLPVSNGMQMAERLDIVWRRGFHRKVPRGCHVAVDLNTGRPCYMQWLIGPSENELVRRLGGFPDLAADEALLENAYTPSSHRGLGIMSAAMAMIAERAEGLGARYVHTFVGTDNPASLKGCQRAGFYPHIMHCRTQHGFGVFVRNSFEPLSQDDPRRLPQLPGGSLQH